MDANPSIFSWRSGRLRHVHNKRCDATWRGKIFCCFAIANHFPIGMLIISAFFATKTKIQKTVKILWAVTTTLAVGSHISTMYRNISHFIAAPLITAIRIFYSTSVAWMIVASQTGHGGRFAKILNYPVFVHINKLSYAIYLLNPALITVIYGIKDHSTHVDPITMVCILLLQRRPRALLISFSSISPPADRYVRWRNGYCLYSCYHVLGHV